MAVLLLATPVAVQATGFSGTPVVVRGSATIAVSGGVQTINIPASSPVTTINWTPTDTAIGGGAIDFLPAGQTVNYAGAATGGLYSVLNRIIPADTTRIVAFNGTVNSSTNTRVWFYTPGGLLIGATAVFNVGGLVLTTADPVAPVIPGTNVPGPFVTTNAAGTDSFSFAGVAGSTSAITIQPGAKISALGAVRSNYIVAIAPRIDQGGSISVAGSVALVAAESASFAVDNRGLFNISVTAGTTVANDTFVHTGSTGGPDAAPSGSYQRVYMVAVPKNNAISMAISAGGTIGFAVADAANVDGDAIVLSAGSNIADTGSGNPVVAGRAGSGYAGLTVGGGSLGAGVDSYTSNTFAVSTDSAIVTDLAHNIGFASNLTVVAPLATVSTQTRELAVAGDLTVDADDTLTGTGGTAELIAGSGSLEVGGNALVSAIGSWGSGTQNNGQIATQGGTAEVAAAEGLLSVAGTLTVTAKGDATDSAAALISSGKNIGATATGGTASVEVSLGATLTATDGITVNADAISGNDSNGLGGDATGGIALIKAEAGGAIGVGVNGAITASASASAADLSTESNFGVGGNSFGGSAQVIANVGTITVAGVNGIAAYADATGGLAPAGSGNGGNATGGTALIATQGASGRIATDTSGATIQSDTASIVSAIGNGGNGQGYGFQGGSAVGGAATVQVSGANQSITIDHGGQLTIDADAVGGYGVGSGGGSAVGGMAQLLAASGGSIAITNANLLVDAIAVGGTDYSSTGGNATAGTVRLAATGGGALNADVTSSLNAFANGGNGSGNGGNALGGNIFIDLGNNAFNFATSAHVNLEASATGGTGDTAGTAASAGGVLVTDLGSFSLGGSLNLIDNTPLYVQAGGSIDVAGGIGESGSGAYAHLWADDLGTGVGTVTLASGALDLPGSQIDIYYNPAALGTPSDFSPGVKGGTVTAYQLVDTIDQLQLAGSYPSQNFALGRNIDASPTQGWNGGAGFVPLGSNGTDFTGNFDGLNHTITNIYIDTTVSGFGDAGLFKAVDASNQNVTIRNVGLVNETVTGQNAVGGLIGFALQLNSPNNDQLIVDNVYNSGTISGTGDVGGLIGLNFNNNLLFSASISNSHSDATVLATGTATQSPAAGGLIGTVFNTRMQNVFATGSVTATGSANGAGGLLGQAQLVTLNGAYATGAVSAGTGSNDIGGLIGYLTSSVGAGASQVNTVYAIGAVTAGSGSTAVGGLVGLITTQVNLAEGWASGKVSASGSTKVGGFIGQNGAAITNSYWDSFSTGQQNSIGAQFGTASNLNPVTSDPAQTTAGNYAFRSGAYKYFTSANWVYDNNETRPVGTWEIPVAQFGIANVASAHQVQLIDFNLAGYYTIIQNIDLRGTAGTTDIWAPGGFMPLGQEITNLPFTGILSGAGHVLSNLTMNPNDNFNGVGLIQTNFGTIADLGLANINITVSQSNYDVGALAGSNYGAITDNFAAGTIALMQLGDRGAVVGGLVGSNGVLAGQTGSITQSYASVAIKGGDFEGSSTVAGGLVGDNEGAISQTFANGAVSGIQTGGLVGESTAKSGATVTTSYWDTQLTGQSAGCGSTGYSGACSGVTGLTTAQTLQAASFTGFTIDTQGGQGLPWRQYQGQTTPLLEAFLTPIVVQPGSLTMQYDATTPSVGVTTYGAQPSLTFGTAQIGGLTPNAGTTALTYAGGLYSNQLGYDFVPSTTPGTLTITPAPLTLAAVSDTRVYDATTNSFGEVLVSGLYGQDSVGSLSQSFYSPNALGTNGSTLLVNPNYVINDGNGGNNYTVTLQTASGTITPAALTLAAASDTRTYDGTTGSNGAVQVSGLVGDDSVGSLSQSFSSRNVMGTNGSTLTVDPGYIVNDGNEGFNYTVTLQSAQGTITPAALTLAAVTDARVYDATTHSSGQVQASGLFGEDNVTNATQSFTSPNALGTNGSTLAVDPGYVVNDGNGGQNYSVVLQNAPGTISPATLAITYAANSASSIYGATIAGLSGTASALGLQGADTLASVTTGAAIFATAATGQSPVGTYAITGAGLTGNSGNYSLSYVQAPGNSTALTITPRPITVTADPQQRQVGATDPVFTYVVTGPNGTDAPGLVNGDVLTGQLSSSATAASLPNTYDIVQGTLAASTNYLLTYVGNSFTLTYAIAPIQDVIDAIAANLPDQTDTAADQHKKEVAAALAALAASQGLHPPQITQSMINDRQVTTPPPINEPVTSNGNSSLWSPATP